VAVYYVSGCGSQAAIPLVHVVDTTKEERAVGVGEGEVFREAGGHHACPNPAN
jgi:hypothetical protein